MDEVTGRVVLHLVHGTWPEGGWLAHRFRWWRKPGPRWYEPDSGFRAYFQQRFGQRLEFDAPPWSGRNGFRARAKAADSLSRHLSERLSDSDALHVVVAHSHGGNVALMALSKVIAGRSTAAPIAMAFLATPFISIERQSDLWERRRWLVLIPRAMVFGLIASLISWTWLTLAIAGAIGVAVAAVAYVALLSIASDAQVDSNIARDLPAPPTLVVRRTGDEAGLVLAIGEIASRTAMFLEWISVGALVLLGLLEVLTLLPLDDWTRSLTSEESFRRLVVKLSGQPPETFTDTGWNLATQLLIAQNAALLAIALIVTLVPPIVTIALSAMVAWAFGPQALAAPGAAFATDASPPGLLCEIEILRASGAGARHSIAETPDCQALLADWIESLPVYTEHISSRSN